MVSIMDMPFSASIPIISTNLASNDGSNPSSLTPWVGSHLDYDLLEEVGYERGDHNAFSEGVPIIVDEVFQQTNNVIQSPIQNVHVTTSKSHGRIYIPKHIKVDESTLFSMEGKITQCKINHHCSQLIKQFFEPNSNAGRCQLFLCLLKSRSLAVVRRKLGIKTLKSMESSIGIV